MPGFVLSARWKPSGTALGKRDGLDRDRGRCRVAGTERPTRRPACTSAPGGTTMRHQRSASPTLVLVFATLLGLDSVGVGRAQQATPAATPAALAWTACADGGWECA